MPLDKPDSSRPVATSIDSSEFTLTIEDAAQLYVNAGHPRTPRSIQRYCANGHLDCHKAETTFGERFFVTPQSVARHIAQIEELTTLEMRATGRDQSRRVAANETPKSLDDNERQPTTAVATGNATSVNSAPDGGRQDAAGRDWSRQDATSEASRDMAEDSMATRYVRTIERENEFLREQVKTKDVQITDLSTRFSETQKLVAGLQRMIAPLLGQADPYRSANDRSDLAEADQTHLQK